MKLNQFAPQFFRVIKDGTFSTLGNLGSSPDEDSLCFLESENYLSRVCDRGGIKCVVCTEQLSKNDKLVASGKGIAVSQNPRRSFYELHNWLAENDCEYGKCAFTTVIGDNCNIHETSIVADRGVIIGNNVRIGEQVIIKPGTIIDDDSVIDSGAIIGGENHIVEKDENGNLFLIKQLGKTHIGKNVAIGYYSMIARGTFPYDETYVGAYTTIENGVEVSHNSKIGKNCIIRGQCQICGNSIIGNNTRINPQSIISNQVIVGNDVTVGIGSVVVSNLKDGAKVAGNFAIDHKKFLFWHKKKLSGR